MNCACCRVIPVKPISFLGKSYIYNDLAGICWECMLFAVHMRLPVSSVADFIELCRDCDPGNL